MLSINLQTLKWVFPSSAILRVTLIIDEIYVASIIEYSCGSINVRLLMDQLHVHYFVLWSRLWLENIMYAMSTLTSRQLHNCYLEGKQTLVSVGLNMADNLAVSRKFFRKRLCSRVLRMHIIDDAYGQPVFFVFDPVHNITNIYNNLIAGELWVPSYGQRPTFRMHCQF